MIAETMRTFPAHVEKIASTAIEIVETTEAWKVVGERTATASAAVLIEFAQSGYRAFAKPANPSSHRPTICAAHEKIVSDLAYLLGLPVPPVVLARPAIDAGFPSIVALSYVPFPQPRKWSERAGIAEFAPDDIDRIASAMAVFHAFVCDTDHGGNDGNQVIDVFFEERYRAAIAFIDYAYSLTHSWNWNGEDPHPPVPCPVAPVPFDSSFTSLDHGTMLLTAERVAALPAQMVGKIVDRIPDDAMPEVVRQRVVHFLIERQTVLVNSVM